MTARCPSYALACLVGLSLLASCFPGDQSPNLKGPRPARGCNDDQACWAGYFCDREERVCRGSAYCYHNGHCPLPYICDFRGTCVPNKPFSPRGGALAPDGGMSLVDAKMPPVVTDAGVPSGAGGQTGIGGQSGGGQNGGEHRDGHSGANAGGGVPATPTMPGISERCQFNHQCGPQGQCVNGLCQRGCDSDARCGTGELCRAKLCQPATGGACVFNADCSSGGTCVNGHCHAHCEGDGICPNTADMCDLGVCRPDVRPKAQCQSNASCMQGWSCVNGVCRTPCRSHGECGEDCSGTMCHGGFCVMPQEVAPQCRLGPDCGANGPCIDATCAR